MSTKDGAPHELPTPVPAHVHSGELLKGKRQVVILHEGQEYRLQVTKNGKLILTK